ncbi:O-antigen ligase family protein [Lacticaseibacillus paracasei]|uniref:O-antigen ligase family protein n=1 Tax=Lacticaseibacillus paracasei TaxID=1597 RepID=UPI0028E09B25|nr:O-antigen ligase family protein [Lacticaseibacillus paracasei]MDT8952613.1 O-antigen ligase family protein [Lacticaseibacillus paracasei subsp. paracasei]
MADEDKIIPSFFKYLWIVVLVPKAVQFVIFAFAMLVLLINHRKQIKFNFIFILAFLFVVIQCLAIIYNSTGQPVTRILAATNTVLIWIISLLFYSLCGCITVDINRIEKYCFINLSILTVLAIIIIISLRLGIQPPQIFGRSAVLTDWLSGESTERLTAYMEYANLIIVFYLLQFPLAFRFAISHFSRITSAILLTLSIVGPLESHSRAGQLVVIVCVGVAIVHLVSHRKKVLIPLALILAVVALILAVYFEGSLTAYITDVLNKRQGSTSMRQIIYSTSISTTLDKSPIIGEGIKLEIMGYPLGSHSTYVGFFYKSGFLGTTLIGCSLFLLLEAITKKSFQIKYGIVIFVSFVCLMSFYIFEDMDGADWALILFWITAALWTGKVKEKDTNLNRIWIA